MQVLGEYIVKCSLLEKENEELKQQVKQLTQTKEEEFVLVFDYLNEPHLYPVTIVMDRYGGIYSKGKYTAWNKDYYELPKGIEGDDIECMEFWNNNTQTVGLGSTPDVALMDLKSKNNPK